MNTRLDIDEKKSDIPEGMTCSDCVHNDLCRTNFQGNGNNKKCHYECTKEEFLESVVDHKMKIVMDDGVNRHIKFKKPYSANNWFDIVTYKGALVIDGDMGTYVFRRLDDMFDFFRESPEDQASLKINPGYWAEKIFATSRYEGGHEHFIPSLFLNAVRFEFDQWVESESPSEEEKDELWGELLSEVIDTDDLDTKRAIEAAHRFRPSNKNISFRMRDFYEHGLKDFTYRFIWNCYAIVWAIKQYDAAKAASADSDSEKQGEILRRALDQVDFNKLPERRPLRSRGVVNPVDFKFL